MSASDKKRLRKEQNNQQMTEKQRREKAEAKKLKAYTWTFSIAMILVVCIAFGVLIARFINQSGVFQKNTIAATIGDHELNTVEFSYFFNDAVNNQYSQWNNEYGDYTDYYLQYIYGINPSVSLDKQICDEKAGTTWADFFISAALNDAKQCYALYDLAKADKDFEIPEATKAELEDSKAIMVEMAKMYGYSDVDDYLVALYGYGADQESYNAYLDMTSLAYAYNTAYVETLKYDDKQLREFEKDIYNQFSSFTFNSYYLSYNSFIKCDDEAEDHEHSEVEIKAAQAIAKKTAEDLAKAKSVKELDKLIADLDINKENESAASTKTTNLLYSEASESLQEWLADTARKNGDIAAIPNYTTEQDEDGNETETVNGYYVVVFDSVNKNTMKMTNVRHLLVKFEGGKTDSNGNTTYTDTEKNKAKTEAEGYLKTWQENEPTKESFIELVKKHSDDGSKDTGGLFEDINPDSQYVENFLNWSIDEKRKEGDAEVIETEYGYHVMYFDSYDELTYRDYLVTNAMKEKDYNEWMEEKVKDYTAISVNMSKLNKDIVISSSSY